MDISKNHAYEQLPPAAEIQDRRLILYRAGENMLRAGRAIDPTIDIVEVPAVQPTVVKSTVEHAIDTAPVASAAIQLTEQQELSQSHELSDRDQRIADAQAKAALAIDPAEENIANEGQSNALAA